MVLHLEPPPTWVGVMVFTSSEARLFSRVVLPALSKPRSTILTSCSVDPFSFSMTESKPCRRRQKEGRSGEVATQTLNRPHEGGNCKILKNFATLRREIQNKHSFIKLICEILTFLCTYIHTYTSEFSSNRMKLHKGIILWHYAVRKPFSL